ncbi:MAG TPA: PA2779 family protein [Burkholderiaceae bacterium]|nr:PA2779 family protein [Burkholderiaceae bacterium]
MNRRFARIVSSSLVVATTALSLPAPVSARVVGTEEALRADAPAGVLVDRGTLTALLEREDVRRQLEAYGVDASQARARVDALTDEEVQRIAGQVGTLPAGADTSILGVVFAIFIILLVTDILGLTRVFPFTRSIR